MPAQRSSSRQCPWPAIEPLAVPFPFAALIVRSFGSEIEDFGS
jgi:hypothetical protein